LWLPFPICDSPLMNLQWRIAATLALGAVAVVTLVLVGTQVSNCLGPLGRTHVQSLADGCTSPYADPATLVAPAFLVIAVLMWFSPPGSSARAAVLGALVCAAIAVALYARFRPTALTGPISTGEVITVILPFDWVQAATAAALSGCAGWVLVLVLSRLRGRLAAR
jgi:hypothetical protein